MESVKPKRPNQSKKGQPVPEGKHGSSTGYMTYGCRCDPCLAWKSGWVAAHPYPQSDAQRRAHRRFSNKSQRATVNTASRANQQWTGAELEIALRADLKPKEAALMLGRSYHAVRHARRDPKKIRIAGVVQN